jgi:hypothetical protein
MKLRSVDVSAHVEKKGPPGRQLSYLSWAWAVDVLLQLDPTASWEYRFNNDGQPFVKIGNTAMVFCTVKAFGVERTAQLPVMDHRNQAIEMPDSFAVNTAMQRCLAKAIALHGIGLYIYAGEDIPPDSSPFQTLGMQEVEVVTRLSQQANIEPQVICSTYNVDKVEDIPLIKFAEIVDRLQGKIKTAAKG